MPKAFAELFTLTADDQNYDAARKLYHEILPIIRMVAGHKYVSASKAALSMMGLPMGDPRSPRLPLPANEMNEVRGILEKLQIKTLAAAQ
jgi:4-hydroxy-tetrahydrodipicolinate synthase